MFSKPDGLDEAALTAALAEQWGFEAVALDHLAVGFGSHHWLATDATGEHRFVTVDDRRIDDLGAALLTAALVRDEGGGRYAVAPLATEGGDVLHRLDERWAVAVYPYLAGVDVTVQEFTTDEHRRAAIDIVAHLHGCDEAVGRHALSHDFALLGRAGLLEALDHLGEPWDRGPYGAEAREVVAHHAHHVVRALDRYDRLVEVGRSTSFVVTHGEPHGGNVVHGRDGWFLVDWDTAQLAPPERDVWQIPDAVEAYEAASGRRLVPEVLDLHRLWWDLSEVAQYATELRAEHAGTADDDVRMRELRAFCDRLAARTG